MKKRNKFSLKAVFATAATVLSLGCTPALEQGPDIFAENEIRGTGSSTCIQGSRLGIDIEYDMSSTDLDRIAAETGTDRDALKRELSIRVMRQFDREMDEYFSQYSAATILNNFSNRQRAARMMQDAFQHAVSDIEEETGLTIRINPKHSYVRFGGPC